MVITDNDIIDLEKELKNPILYNYLIKNYAFQELKTKQLEVDNFLEKYLLLKSKNKKEPDLLDF